MKTGRPTISGVVVDLLTRNHPIYQHIRMGLINYHALAARIKPTVDRITGRDVNVNTIVVIIKRFSDAQSKIGLPLTMSVLRNSKMTLSSGVVDVTINPKREAFITELKKLVELSAELNERPHIFPLVSSIKIIADANDYEKLKTALKSRYSLKPRLNAAKITIHLSEEAERSPGIAAYITDLLYRNGINIVDAFLGYEEIILILDESDGPRAYTILEEETGKGRK
ncbi:MAG: hypothetical protein ABSD49_13675 [Candidatus Bathyarchaeia archaeon]